jgi:2-oxoglutarate ferredoxin oxidoreductase subunit gamma
MATTELVIAGFGGQGILFLGEVLAHAAVIEGKNATWMPAYGPEQRGGTATCTVVIADEPIGSPVVSDPPVVIVMNRPSLDKFEPRVRPAGLLIVNSSLVDRPAERTDVRVVEVDAVREATGLGDARAANMVLLGAFLEAMPVVSREAVEQALRDLIPPARAQMVGLNLAAIARGAAIAGEQGALQRV